RWFISSISKNLMELILDTLVECILLNELIQNRELPVVNLTIRCDDISREETNSFKINHRIAPSPYSRQRLFQPSLLSCSAADAMSTSLCDQDLTVLVILIDSPPFQCALSMHGCVG